ncbi:hypothetical protein Tco_0489496 [Tanacetum coccineum]
MLNPFAYKLQASARVEAGFTIRFLYPNPIEIMDREVKQLRLSRVPIVKVRWNSKRGPVFTWELTLPEIHSAASQFWGCYTQWLNDEKRVVNQDQRLKSIIISCLPDDIIELVISCKTNKDTWTDLVHSFEGPSDTKENRILDLKLKYNTFRAKPSKSLSQTYTQYKTLLNKLSNIGVKLSKHEINVAFMNSLPEKWLSFSQGLRNANHIQTLDLADIYGRFVYEDNLISRRYIETKKAMITAPSTIHISTAFFSNNISKNKGLVVETFDWDDDEVSDDEEMVQIKVLMALANDELIVGKTMLEMVNGLTSP